MSDLNVIIPLKRTFSKVYPTNPITFEVITSPCFIKTS